LISKRWSGNEGLKKPDHRKKASYGPESRMLKNRTTKPHNEQQVFKKFTDFSNTFFSGGGIFEYKRKGKEQKHI